MKFSAFILAAMLIVATTATTTIPAMAEPLQDCKCVVFRYDDVQGTWNNELQLQTLQLFIDKQVPATLGIIMEPYGQDEDVVEITKRGNRLGYFDLALHGWQHVNHATLSRYEQENGLYNALKKFEQIHGFTPTISIMPYDEYNNDTLETMQFLGLRVISANMNHPSGYFKEYNVTAIHDTIRYIEHIEKKTPNEELVKLIKSDIEKYGYSMILLHPQEFRLEGQNNVLDTEQLARLAELIDLIRAEDIPFSTIHEMAFGTEPPRVMSKHEVTIEDDPETKAMTPIQQIVLWFQDLYKALFLSNNR